MTVKVYSVLVPVTSTISFTVMACSPEEAIEIAGKCLDHGIDQDGVELPREEFPEVSSRDNWIIDEQEGD